MQTRYPDAAWRFTSLGKLLCLELEPYQQILNSLTLTADDVYYYGGQTSHNVKALYDHVPDISNGEIELKVGDLIGECFERCYFKNTDFASAYRDRAVPHLYRFQNESRLRYGAMRCDSSTVL